VPVAPAAFDGHAGAAGPRAHPALDGSAGPAVEAERADYALTLSREMPQGRGWPSDYGSAVPVVVAGVVGRDASIWLRDRGLIISPVFRSLSG
jgi:hypothetical protein